MDPPELENEQQHGPGPGPSSSSSSIPIPIKQPISGATLYALELERRERLSAEAEEEGGSACFCATGCPEIDREVLGAGGWERGTVVGVSAEGGGEMGLLVGGKKRS
ncbi:hypothetical protein F4809DRAFT_417754, partial [Biscogniauxia mediterranea]